MTMASTSLPMTRGRRLTLAIGVPVAVALILVCVPLWARGALQVVANHDQVGYSVAVSAPVRGGQVKVTSGNGDLVFRTSRTAHDISVRGHLSGALARPTFSHQSTATGLDLNSGCNAPFGNCNISFTVTAPAGLPVTLDDAFGNLTAGHLSGPVSLSNNSGDIDTSDLDGRIQLNDQFGNIWASQLRGTMRMVNNSGDINVSGATGDTQLQDSFGNIYLTGLAAASVVATNNSGDITLRFATVPTQVNVTDSFGNVTLILPAGAVAYQVHTHDSFGSTSVSVAQSPTSAHVIRVNNNSGDITIRTQD
jgi:S-adenosylmethionine hydrolase